MTDDPTLLTPQDDLQPGALFAGKYRIQRLLGKGGFGAVYLVKNEEIGWEMALKLLHPEHGADPAYRARFLREMGLARDLLHPNAVPVRDAGVESGRLYYTMDFVPGKSLKDVIHKEGRIAPARAAEWMKQVLSFLTFLHGKHYIHRDLKPDNLIVQDENGVERIRVLDLGIAKSIAASAETMGLTGGSVIGTPHYMAPEHAAGDEVDARIDLYAIGVIFYECCRGARPFHEPTLQKLFHSIRTQEAPPLPKVVQGFPEAMWQVIARALEKDRELRYRDAKAFVAAIDQVLPELSPAEGTVVQTPGAGPQEPSGPTLKQGGGGSGRKVLAAVVAVLVLAAAGVGLMFALADTTAPRITDSSPKDREVVSKTPVTLTIYSDDELARATIAGNEATVTGSEARADVAFSGLAAPREIKVFLWDKAGNSRESIVVLKWQPAADSGEEPLAILRQVPGPTEPQKQPFTLELTANRALTNESTIGGRGAEVKAARASLRVDWLGGERGEKEIPVKLVDGAGNPPLEKTVKVFWQPDTGTAPQAKPKLPAGLVAMPDAPDDASGYPKATRHGESGIEFILFPATGSDGFWRGETKPPKDGQHVPFSPRQKIIIERPFYLSRSLVTRAQYLKLKKLPAANEGAPELPMTGITYGEAASYCGKISGARIPTESEWEWSRYCAIGGRQPFPWGSEEEGGEGWANTNEIHTDTPKLATSTTFPKQAILGALAYQLFDLTGNAAEYCRDAYVPYSDFSTTEVPTARVDPGLEMAGALEPRVIRGSSCEEPRSYCNLVRRRSSAEFVDKRLSEVGFRVCIPLPK